MRTAILTATILVAVAPAVVVAQYAPPRGQSQWDAMGTEALIMHMCVPGGSRSRSTLPAGRAPTQTEAADYLADRIADRLAQPPQVDAECAARLRATNAAKEIQPSTLYAVTHYRGGYTALYVGGTHYCGDRQPMVAVQQGQISPMYGCWTQMQDNKGVPAVSIRMDHGKSVLWRASEFKRPDGSVL